VRAVKVARRLAPLIPLLAVGKTNIEIAQALSVSKHTAEKYVSDLKALLDARDRVELVLACRGLEISS
jgi:DNA-binding NarL/FixJ family response regulator